MELADRLPVLRAQLATALTQKVPQADELIAQYVQFMTCDDISRPYNIPSPEKKRWLDGLVQTVESEALESLHQTLLIVLMESSLTQLQSDSALPEPSRAAVKGWFAELCDRIESPPTEWGYQTDFFQKDLAIAALKMWPSHSICHYEYSVLPKAFLKSHHLQQFFSGLCLMFKTLRSYKPLMYELHTEDRRQNPHFLEEGWHNLYLELAQRMTVEPHISGLFGQSWFWDPQVSEQSKKMDYLRRLPESGGARFFRLFTSDDPNHIALNHKKRRALFEQGKYCPTSYLLVWPREALLRWADQQ